MELFSPLSVVKEGEIIVVVRALTLFVDRTLQVKFLNIKRKHFILRHGGQRSLIFIPIQNYFETVRLQDMHAFPSLKK